MACHVESFGGCILASSYHTSHFDVHNSSLAELFENHFEIVPADKQIMLDKVYRIRHQVYCEELGFEPQHVNQLEQDAFDHHSIHCLLRHKSSQSYIGCVRLVLLDSRVPEQGFPFEQVCGKSLRRAFDRTQGTSHKRYGEISRLAITANFRRPRLDRSLNAGHPRLDLMDGEARPLFPSVALGLYLAIAAMGLNQGLDGVFAMMENRLARQLRRFGIHFQQVGEAVEHRGTRVPYFISSHFLQENLTPECRLLLRKIQNCLMVPVPQWS